MDPAYAKARAILEQDRLNLLREQFAEERSLDIAQRRLKAIKLSIISVEQAIKVFDEVSGVKDGKVS